MDEAKKSLGQHWLNDPISLQAICDAAQISPTDTVLEIGPGHGSLTKYLVERAGRVIAIEKDETLAPLLKMPKLEVIAGDILKFDFGSLPHPYKIVANIPYYLTSYLLRLLGETANMPELAALLVQKEVAERVCAEPGQMSLLAVSVQLHYQPSLGQVVPARLFVPPPKVDSQVLLLHRRTEPLFRDLDKDKFFKVVKAGFSEKRKKLRSSLAGGLGLSKDAADTLLTKAGISGDLRAQNLSLADWHKLYQAL